MPFEKSGVCPFKGSHWPTKWGEKSITKKSFNLILQEEQKTDLIEYFYEQESAKKSANSQPRFRFPLTDLRDYFGANACDLKKAVMFSKEYNEYVAERQRQPPPPPPAEMEPLTSVRIAEYLIAAAPEDEDTRLQRADDRDSKEKSTASIDQVVRKAKRKDKGISTSMGVPLVNGKYIDATSRNKTKQETLEFSQSKIVVCNMQRVIEEVVKNQCEGGGLVNSQRQQIFTNLVKEEEEKERNKDLKRFKILSGSYAPFRARAALGLVLLLSSVLWYVSACGPVAQPYVEVAINYALCFLPWPARLTGSPFFFISYSPIFEIHGDTHDRNGSEQRLQCEGHLWERALGEWFKEEAKEKANEQEAAVQTQKAGGGEYQLEGGSRKRKAGGSIQVAQTQEPDERAIQLEKLKMGLDIVKDLAQRVNKSVLGTGILTSEPGCEHFDEHIAPENTSLLISVPRQLEEYPGRTASRSWMGAKSAMRFHAAQRETVPADGAAPAARTPDSQGEVAGFPDPNQVDATRSADAEEAAGSVSPDQVSHLDALISGLIVLLNMMPGFAYVGVHLNSGGCIHALKELIRTDYGEFCGQFKVAMTADGRLLSQAMKGRNAEENLDTAWRLYTREKLGDKGFTKKFERAYIELEEFEMLLGSMSVYHFGARYPCFSGHVKIPLDWWHLRLHLYIGNRLVKRDEAIADDEGVKKAAKTKAFFDEPVAKSTIDLISPPEVGQWRALKAADQYLAF